MKVLFVNKFLYPRAGAERYMFSLADELKSRGHRIAYFGMEHERNIVNIGRKDINVSGRDFRKAGKPGMLLKAPATVYSTEARRKIARVLKLEKPDIVHLNNINYQLTPSIIFEIHKLGVPMVMTLHDANIVCPNHSLYNYQKNEICTGCSGGSYMECIRTRCIHGSLPKSIAGAVEATVYRGLGIYRKIDVLVSPSRFMAGILKKFGLDHPDVKVMHNFSPAVRQRTAAAGEYVLYFGRLCISKGMDVLKKAAQMLPDIQFVAAGEGDCGYMLDGCPNIRKTGYLSGGDLIACLLGARMVVVPSNWHENCSMSILEAKSFGLPVIASDTGGTPEIVRHGRDGFLFERGNAVQLAGYIRKLYRNMGMAAGFSMAARAFCRRNSLRAYGAKMVNVYKRAGSQIREAGYGSV